MTISDADCKWVTRAADTIAWPRDKLLIHIINSTMRSDVQEHVEQIASALRVLGHNVQAVRCAASQGSKAGSVNAGLEQLPPGFEPEYVANL